MNVELIKRMLDACYLAKRTREMLPPLPNGVMPSYIQYIDVIKKLEQQGIKAKVSDISDALDLPRPGVTRSVKEMEMKGYLEKNASPEDGRVIYLSVTEAGEQLSQKYDAEYFRSLAPYLQDIPDADVETMIRTIEAFYKVMYERRDFIDKQ